MDADCRVAQSLSALYEAERKRLFHHISMEKPGDFLNPVFGQGAIPPCLLLIGEAPGGEEALLGKPFVGKAGKHLDTLLLHANITRERIYITNTVKYRPVTLTKRGMKNRTPSTPEIQAGLALLKQEILQIKPPVIATLGNTPLSAIGLLAKRKLSTIGDMHGSAHEISIDDFSSVLFPLYHPASIIYNPALLSVCEADSKCLGELVNNR